MEAIHRFSSNWRELRTLVASLNPTEQGHADFRGIHLFYFTENSTTYHCVHRGSSTSPQLHRLVQLLKLLEIQQGCRLDVIHVHGTTMIQQGKDAQSRGVWRSSLHDNSHNITADVFCVALPINLAHSSAPVSSFKWETDLSAGDPTDLIGSNRLRSLSPLLA
jgi:hypothetical protein